MMNSFRAYSSCGSIALTIVGIPRSQRTTKKVFAGRTYIDLAGFAPSSEWEFISKDARDSVVTGDSGDVQLHAD